MIVVAFVPTEAAKRGFDKGICGDCPLKLSQTGSCYVNMLPVNNIYRKYATGSYPKFSANEIEVVKRYTHQFHKCDSRWKQYLMASVQSESEACIAQSQGWRTFRIIAPDTPLSENEILCSHTQDDRIQCETCLLCDGASSKPNIADRVHGLKWKVSNFVKYSNSLSN